MEHHGSTPGQQEEEAGRWKRISGQDPQCGDAAATAPLCRLPPCLRPFPSPAHNSSLLKLGEVAHTCNPSTLGGRGRRIICGQEFKTSLANVFLVFLEMVFLHVGQAGLECLTSGDPPTLASLSARITGMSHHTWL
ncbi:hypothetical protein AAY473_006581 [Plecturocebus cupreus]